MYLFLIPVIRESESAIYNKSDVWRHGQVVFVLAGRDKWGTQKACADNMRSLAARLVSIQSGGL
jgi:hypothetical protein